MEPWSSGEPTRESVQESVKIWSNEISKSSTIVAPVYIWWVDCQNLRYGIFNTNLKSHVFEKTLKKSVRLEKTIKPELLMWWRSPSAHQDLHGRPTKSVSLHHPWYISTSLITWPSLLCKWPSFHIYKPTNHEPRDMGFPPQRKTLGCHLWLAIKW